MGVKSADTVGLHQCVSASVFTTRHFSLERGWMSKKKGACHWGSLCIR